MTRPRFYSKRRANPYVGYHKDVGCELAPSCLSCPFPECVDVLADGNGRKAMRKVSRLREIVTLMNSGKSELETAIELGVHVRTIQRALADKEAVLGVAG